MQKNSIFFLYLGLILQTNQQFAIQNDNLTPLLYKSNEQEQVIKNKKLLFHPENELLNFFLRPIKFSPHGIQHFFMHTYNHEKYTEYLPYTLDHMIQFLEYGQQHKQDERYALSIIKLFLQKIKGCDFVNSYSLITAMPKLADNLTPYVQKKEASFLQELQQSLKKRFTHIFSTYSSYFQKNPDAFLEALSEQIAKKTNEVQTQQHISVEHVRKDVLRFLEICMNKLVWSPDEAYDAWISIHELAEQSHNFLTKKLINDADALDDIYWSLIHRFCYFIEISHDSINEEIFKQIITDIYTQDLLLFAIEEQENFITSKKDYVLRKIKNYYTPKTFLETNTEDNIAASNN